MTAPRVRLAPDGRAVADNQKDWACQGCGGKFNHQRRFEYQAGPRAARCPLCGDFRIGPIPLNGERALRRMDDNLQALAKDRKFK